MSLLLLSAIFILVLSFSGLMAMAGLGAAFLFVPLFLAFGIPFTEAASTALLLNALSLLVSTFQYVRAGLVRWRVGVPMLVAAVILSPLGAWLSNYTDPQGLKWGFIAFLLFAGTMMLFYKAKTKTEELSKLKEVSVGLSVGAGAGFLGGMLGVGGGNFILPSLNALAVETKIAAGTTALVVFFSSLSGFLGHISLGHANYLLMIVASGGALIGSALGSWVMRKKISGPQLKKLIGILLYVVAAVMTYKVLWP